MSAVTVQLSFYLKGCGWTMGTCSMLPCPIFVWSDYELAASKLTLSLHSNYSQVQDPEPRLIFTILKFMFPL